MSTSFTSYNEGAAELSPRFLHAYILCGGTASERETRASSLAAAVLCGVSEESGCGVCRHCKKAYAGIHPDIITISRESDEKGQPRREIYIHQIRNLTSDAYVMPNEADKKVYIVLDADTMNHSAQNAMLKLLEEPPGKVTFILCARNKESLLPTVRSRCVLMALGGNSGSRQSGELAELALEYAALAIGKDPAALLRFCAQNEKMDQAAAAEFVRSAREHLADMLCGRKGGNTNEILRIIKLAELLDKTEVYLKRNVGVKHVFGLLSVDAPCSNEGKDRIEN